MSANREVTIQRKTQGDDGTFGELTVKNSPFKCFSAELPWRDNFRGRSRVRPGTYKCLWQFSVCHHKQVYHLQDVPCRTDVEIHAGNWCGDVDKGLKSDVKGCIILGDEIGALDGQKAVLHSKKTVQAFETEMCLEPFTLVILDIPGGVK